MISISETIKNKAKEQKGGFLRKLLGTLAEIISGNMVAGKPKGVIRPSEGIIRASERWIAKSQGRGTTRAGQDS